MLNLRTAAALLASADSIDALIRIVRTIGFDGAATPVDAELGSALALPAHVVAATIVQGPGSLRILAVETANGPALRETLTTVASRIASRSPYSLWLVIGVDPASATTAIGAVHAAARHSTRVAALIVDRSDVVDSDAETLRLLAAAHGVDDLATHGRFVEILGRDSLSRRFFRALDGCVQGLAESASAGPAAARSEIALLYTSRLLFMAFLEARGWLDDDADFLARRFDDCMGNGGAFHGRVLLPLFFGTLNTPARRRAARARAFGTIPFLNGGLFTPTSIEKRFAAVRFSDEAYGRLFGDVFTRYRFTAREETASFEEAAIDPEMLGRAFECLMSADSRRSSGAFYTPHELVQRVTSCGLERALAMRFGTGAAERITRGNVSADPSIVSALRDLRVLDPACGSGAFLVHALDRIAELRAAAGDEMSAEAIRRDVLARSIHGVDVNPTAVWLCQLRLWLSIVIDSRADAASSVRPLPNLDRNIRVGDSLAGEAFGDRTSAAPTGRQLSTLRQRYARATGRRKATLARMLDREERRLVLGTVSAELASVSAARRDLVHVRRGRDLFGGRYVSSRDEARHAAELRDRSADLRRRLASVRRGDALPFSFPAHFADVADGGGFSLIVGNPPWVRPHRVDVPTREALRRRYTVASAAAWSAGAEAAGAGRGFSGQVDLAALFVERSLRLLAPGAALSLLLPSKLWRSLSAGGLRHLMLSESIVANVEDYSDVPTSFDASVYPGLLVAVRPTGGEKPAASSQTSVTVLHRERLATSWRSRVDSLALDKSIGAPWLLVPPDARRAFDRLRSRGTPLASSPFGRPLLGVKCGLNEAYIVNAQRSDDGRASVASANGRRLELEASSLRPVIRGEGLRPWSRPEAAESILWPHDERGEPLASLPPDLARWFAPHRRALLARSDARNARRWWSLFRTEAARHDVPRVVWADIGRTPRATVLDAGDDSVPLNSCYVARCPSTEDALALCALMNSPLLASWLSVIAEPARGGYRRFLGWTMALLPIPIDWVAHRGCLADLATRARRDLTSVSRSELLDASIAAYRLSRREIETLLEWSAP